MGNAKARGTYEQRKTNPLGLKSNHYKGIFDFNKLKGATRNFIDLYLKDKNKNNIKDK